MMNREAVESYLLQMGLEPEELDDDLWIIRTADETPVVVHFSPPLLVLRIKVMDLPSDNGDNRLAPLYRRLLELNATDIVHGSYGIEENEVVLSDALDLETLDFGELRNSYESLVLAASTHLQQLGELVPVPQQG
jgi:hypothetical protein